MIKNIARGCAVLTAAMACLAGALPAQAATGSRWRLQQLVGSPANNTDPAASIGGSNVAAGSLNAAWSIWGTCSPSCTSAAALVEHWNGSRWSPVPSRRLPGLSNPIAVAASSATNAWIFSAFSPGQQATARHWNGVSWHTRSVPSWVVRGNLAGEFDVQAADFGRGGLWVFSLGQESITRTTPYAARYQNGQWRKAALPAIPSDISAVSASDIWALGTTQSSPSRQVLMHWNGLRWSTLRLPSEPLPTNTTGYFGAVGGSGARSAWVIFDTQTGTQGAVSKFLLHWTGHWSKVLLPKGTSVAYVLVADGHGGMWAVGNGPKPSYPWRFFHRSNGSWTTIAVPGRTGLQLGGVESVVRVPGSREMFAVGHGFVSYLGNSDNVGLIWRYSS